MKIRILLCCLWMGAFLGACRSIDELSTPTSTNRSITPIPSQTSVVTQTRSATHTSTPLATSTITPRPTHFRSSLLVFIENLDLATGFVRINGADSRQPSTPFHIDWGDGTIEDAFFPLEHTYIPTRNYTMIITAYYSEGGETFQDSLSTEIEFVLTSITSTSTMASPTGTATSIPPSADQGTISLYRHFIYQIGAVSDYSEIHLASLDGTSDQKLVDGGISDLYPPNSHVSPDGSQFVYLSRGYPNVYNVDTGINTALSWNNAIRAPRWSFDSRYLLGIDQYILYASEPGGGIAEMSLPQDCESLYFADLALHPDGHLTIICKPWNVPDGSAFFQASLPADFIHQAPVLSFTPVNNPFGEWRIANHQWSPDGKMIALLMYDENYATSLVVFNPTNNQVIELTSANDIGSFSMFAWSPNSQKIAYFYMNDPNDQTYHLYVINSDGSNRVNLTYEFQWIYPYCPPSWSADSMSLLFSDQKAVYQIVLDGTNLLQLTSNVPDIICPEYIH